MHALRATPARLGDDLDVQDIALGWSPAMALPACVWARPASRSVKG